jgi:hypothetical protein
VIFLLILLLNPQILQKFQNLHILQKYYHLQSSYSSKIFEYPSKFQYSPKIFIFFICSPKSQKNYLKSSYSSKIFIFFKNLYIFHILQKYFLQIFEKSSNILQNFKILEQSLYSSNILQNIKKKI